MIRLCATTDIEDGKAKGFELELDDDKRAIFVVHKDGEFFGYVNICPHQGVNLDWMPDQFLDPDGALIQCSTHDALFLIDTGECVRGPCAGASLQSLAIKVEAGEVFLDEAG